VPGGGGRLLMPLWRCQWEGMVEVRLALRGGGGVSTWFKPKFGEAKWDRHQNLDLSQLLPFLLQRQHFFTSIVQRFNAKNELILHLLITTKHILISRLSHSGPPLNELLHTLTWPSVENAIMYSVANKCKASLQLCRSFGLC
jgi:hypothetical protein